MQDQEPMGVRCLMKPAQPKSKWSKGRIIVFAFLGLFLCSILVFGGALALKIHGVREGSVAIVTRPGNQSGLSASPSGPANATEVTETTLPPIEQTPSDIDVDYNPDVKDPSIDPIYEKSPTSPDIVNIILLGSDARPDEKIGRSDLIMLLSYNRKQGSVKLVSIMRDAWVRIEGHDWNRINAAYVFGGVGLAINTVNDNFGLDIQNYVAIRFDQFILIVDQMGGVSLDLTKAEIEYINSVNPETKLDTQAGLKLLNGAQTLTHCRNRKVGNGDFDRTRRQRSTMLAILTKLKRQNKPATLARLVNFALKNVNSNMKATELFNFAIEALENDNLKIDDARIPFDKTWHYANEDGRSVVAIDIAKNKTLLNTFLYG